MHQIATVQSMSRTKYLIGATVDQTDAEIAADACRRYALQSCVVIERRALNAPRRIIRYDADAEARKAANRVWGAL